MFIQLEVCMCVCVCVGGGDFWLIYIGLEEDFLADF